MMSNYRVVFTLFNFNKIIFFTIEIVHSTVCSSDGMGRPKLFGPKLIVKVKKLTEKAVEELTAGIWLCSFCAKTEKSFFYVRSSHRNRL